MFMNANVDVTNCTYGLFAIGSGATIGMVSAGVLSGNALTYGASASYGAMLILPTAVTTITGGTAEMSIDNGTVTGTWASLVASYSCLNKSRYYVKNLSPVKGSP